MNQEKQSDHHHNTTPGNPATTPKPLDCCVRELMQNYFRDLDGHRPSDLYRAVIDEVERPLLEVVLEVVNSNRTEASQILGINRGTLLKKIKYHQLT